VNLGKEKTKSGNAKRAGREHFGIKTKVGMQTKTKITGERMREMKIKPNNISSVCGREKKQKSMSACYALHTTALVTA
jgi:hypothetical protein